MPGQSNSKVRRSLANLPRCGGWVITRAGLLLAASLALPAGRANAQVAGDTDVVIHELQFDTAIQDLPLDPAPNTGIRVEQTFWISETGDLSNQIAGSFVEAMFDAIGIPLGDLCIDFGLLGEFCVLDDLILPIGGAPSFYAGVDVLVGGYFEIIEANGADISVTYPVEVEIEYPAPNTFRCGQTITVQTSCGVVSGADLTVVPPFYNTEVGIIIDSIALRVSIQFFDFCLIPIVDLVCLSDFIDLSFDIPIAEVPLPDIPPLFTVCAAGVGTDDTDSLLGCSEGGDDLLRPFIGALDVDTAPGETCLAPGPLVPHVPEMEACFRLPSPGALLFDQSGGCNQNLQLLRSGQADGILEASTDVVSWVDEVLCPLPSGLSCTGVNFGAFVLDLGDISPVYQIDQEMDFAWEPTVYLSLEMIAPPGHGELPYRVIDPNTGGIVSSGMGPDVRLMAGHHLEIDFPQTLRDPATMFPLYDVESDLNSETWHHYSMGAEFRLFQLEIDGVFQGTVVNEEIFMEELDGSPQLVEDATTALDEFFSVIDQSTFLLDPEKPIIDITGMSVEDVLNLGHGERAVVYRVDVRNNGDVTLSDVACILDLAAIFETAPWFRVDCVYSADLIVNPDYDGDADTNLLDDGNVLAVAQQSTIELLVIVKPEIAAIDEDGCFEPVEYFALAKAYGTSPIGTRVENNLNPCTGEVTGTDIIAPVDLGAAIINGLDDYAIYGWDGVVLARAFELSKGNVGSSRGLDVLPLTAQFANDPRIIGDIHVGEDVHVANSPVTIDYAQVTEDLHVNGPLGSLILTGALSEASDCAALQPEPSLSLVQPDSQERVEVPADGSVEVPPGDYGRFTIAANGELILTAGSYNVGMLRIEGDGATVAFDLSDGPIVLNLHQWLMLPVEGVRLVVHEDSGSTRDIQINYAGNRKQIFRNALIQGNVLAPHAEIRLDDGTRLEGACYAKKVRVGPFSQFIYHKFLEPLNIDPACRNVVPRQKPARPPKRSADPHGPHGPKRSRTVAR